MKKNIRTSVGTLSGVSVSEADIKHFTFLLIDIIPRSIFERIVQIIRESSSRAGQAGVHHSRGLTFLTQALSFLLSGLPLLSIKHNFVLPLALYTRL